jgi:hypothetical protein
MRAEIVTTDNASSLENVGMHLPEGLASYLKGKEAIIGATSRKVVYVQ